MAKRAPKQQPEGQQANKPEAGAQAAAATVKKTRLTPEEAQARRIERERKQLEKAAAQKARKEAQLLKIAEREAKAKQRLERDLNKEPRVRTPKVELPVIEKAVFDSVAAKTKDFIASIAAETGLQFELPEVKMTRQGHGLSFHVNGVVEGVKRGLKRIAGVSREATRFLAMHKTAGLSKSILDKQVTFKELTADEKPVTGTWKVIGLKGRKLDVVVENDKSEQMTVELGVFKEQHQVVQVA